MCSRSQQSTGTGLGNGTAISADRVTLVPVPSPAESLAPRAGTVQVTANVDAATWDGWPDGWFEHTFSTAELEETNQLAVHWSCEASGATSGSDQADDWHHGRKLERRCRGVLSCSNQDCQVITRAGTTFSQIQKQLARSCICGGSLRHTTCSALQVLMRFRHGIHFIHKGFHMHPRPTHILHLSKRQKERFTALVEQNPRAGPLELLVGVRTLKGPGASAADISPVLHNKDRISHELKAIRKGQKSQHGYDDLNIGEFAQFCSEHPGFIIHSMIREVVVISMQQPLMLAELVKETRLTTEPVNGVVTDAAHGFWKQRNCLLIISSAYSSTLHRWIPGILSYTNGATSDHYRHHFLALFQSIARERRSRNWDTSRDDDFSTVSDNRISITTLLRLDLF